MDKTDTIVDFLQMIFKIITENLQTGNTSASQNSKESQFPTHSPDINQIKSQQKNITLIYFFVPQKIALASVYNNVWDISSSVTTLTEMFCA